MSKISVKKHYHSWICLKLIITYLLSVFKRWWFVCLQEHKQTSSIFWVKCKVPTLIPIQKTTQESREESGWEGDSIQIWNWMELHLNFEIWIPIVFFNWIQFIHLLDHAVLCCLAQLNLIWDVKSFPFWLALNACFWATVWLDCNQNLSKSHQISWVSKIQLHHKFVTWWESTCPHSTLVMTHD